MKVCKRGVMSVLKSKLSCLHCKKKPFEVGFGYPDSIHQGSLPAGREAASANCSEGEGPLAIKHVPKLEKLIFGVE